MMPAIGFGDESVVDVSADQAASAIGFNNCGRAAASNNDLCAALLALAGRDLRQLLQIIIGAHDMLAKMLSGRPAQLQLARAETAARYLNDRLDHLVDALRLFDPASSARQEVVSLPPIFTLLEAEFAEAALRKGIRLRIVPACTAVLSNPVLLSGILRNLIQNAIDYTPSGGKVLVAARRCGALVHLEVRDNGIGIAVGDLAEVFKPFRRVDNTRTEGLGLGLFIVNCAAGFLGHRIEVDSAVGRGSRFVIVAKDARVWL